MRLAGINSNSWMATYVQVYRAQVVLTGQRHKSIKVAVSANHYFVVFELQMQEIINIKIMH